MLEESRAIVYIFSIITHTIHKIRSRVATERGGVCISMHLYNQKLTIVLDTICNIVFIASRCNILACFG